MFFFSNGLIYEAAFDHTWIFKYTAWEIMGEHSDSKISFVWGISNFTDETGHRDKKYISIVK